jgi:hypothetical protein
LRRSGRQVALAALDLGERLFDHAIDQVVGLHAEALAARHFDERLLGFFRIGIGREAELARGRVRERDHLVREVGEPIRFGRVADRHERLLQQFLQVRLAHVDHVVGRGGVAELRVVLDGQ